MVSILRQKAVDGEVWYQIGPNQRVHSSHTRTVAETPRPIGVAPDEKWITVNLSEQSS